MSTLLPDIENTDVQTTLKGKASGELARTMTAYTEARQALLKPLRDYRDSLEELAHLLQRCAQGPAHTRPVDRTAPHRSAYASRWDAANGAPAKLAAAVRRRPT